LQQIISLVKQIFFFLYILLFFSAAVYAQSVDTLSQPIDTAATITPLKPDTALNAVDTAKLADTLNVFEKSVRSKLFNRLLNTGTPVAFTISYKQYKNKDTLFYVIAGMVLLLAFFKYIYNRYFINLFRVFFNTSLKQSQLTDQLLQSKFPSLMFNLFFVISAGLYAYLVSSNKGLIRENDWLIAFFAVALIGAIYVVKYCTLKFTGWVAGMAEVTNTYIFVIFLINKIIGIFLVPFIIILAFSSLSIVKIATLVSLMCIGLFLLLRYFRSYGLLQNQLKISKFHFMLYILGIELLPLLLIYKALMVYFK